MIESAYLYDARMATELAAIAVLPACGTGDKEGADGLAVDAMRRSLSGSLAHWRVVIGEGERDAAPMLYIGEELGLIGEGARLDIALDPLEGTSLAAAYAPGALSVMSVSRAGGLLHAPDVYMRKLAVGSGVERGAVNLGMSPGELVGVVGECLRLTAGEVCVSVLERERHAGLVEALRRTGCRVQLFSDGDVAACLGLCLLHGTHLYLGVGGAPEGVLSASGLSCLGGYFEGSLIFRDSAERERAEKAGITDLNRVYAMDDLAHGELAFVATGVTSGALLEGVCRTPRDVWCESLVIWNTDETDATDATDATDGMKGGGSRVERIRSRRLRKDAR
ncbi:MAG: fructose-bisphosphatase class II family protein [Alphaproteobacteria bacterium]